MVGAHCGDGIVDDEGAGVCPGARPVDTAGGALVVTFPDVDLPPDASVFLNGHALGPTAPVEDPPAAQSPDGAVGTSSRRQRRQSRSHRRQLDKRNAATAASFLR